MLEQCHFYESQVMAVKDTPVIKTMPINLYEIQKHQLEEKCQAKMLGTDKRSHVKNFHGQDS